MKRTPQQMVDALAALFVEEGKTADELTFEQIEQGLIDAGYDMDEINRQSKELAARVVAYLTRQRHREA